MKGVPITKYCDEKRLSLRDRLELMIPVCQAIQHAHQKGIIHRDIKPTNVLVAQYDGKPVPKVIDFGVAKATAQKLTERTMFTELGQIIGTLEYMSPEQAELNQLDIDTRSDIYSLGVLLYELLTGSTPFDKQKLRTAAFHEMLRIIREDEPPKPSTNLSTNGTLPSIAANRQTEPARLSKAVRGELDWIVMKALDKDRNRRYETANGFAADIQRYLDDEQVQACPPTAGYRFRKFARRNKATLTTTAVVAAALIIGTAVSTWQAVRATAAEAQATANEAKAKTEELKALAAAQSETTQRRRAETSEQEAKNRLVEVDLQRKQAEKNFEAALEAVDRMLANVGDPELNDVPRVGPLRRKMLKDAIAFYERIPLQSEVSAKARFHMAKTWERMLQLSWWLNDVNQARHACQMAIEAISPLVQEQPAEAKFRVLLAGLYAWGQSLFGSVDYIDYAEAEKWLRRSSQLFAELAHSDPKNKSWLIRDAGSLTDLAIVLRRAGKRGEALDCARHAMDLLELSGEASHHSRASVLIQMAESIGSDRPAERDDLYRRAIAEFQKYLSEGKYAIAERWNYANLLLQFAGVLVKRDPNEAETLLDESITVMRESPPNAGSREAWFIQVFLDTHLDQARLLRRLATVRPAIEDQESSAARLAKAESLFQEAIATQRANAARGNLALAGRNRLVQMLEEESRYLLGAASESHGVERGHAPAPKLQADALLTEAIQLCRQLTAEFPKDATYTDRLASLLKFQAQHFGQEKGAPP